MIEDGFDLVIRWGVSTLDESSSIICTKISHVDLVLVCSPEHIRIHRRPENIGELSNLPFLKYSSESKSIFTVRFDNVDGSNQVVN